MLLRAVGIQGNYIEEVTGEIDRIRSGCNDCVNSFYPDCKECQACTSKCFITKKVYINEKNMHGSQVRLNANALKMLLLFHFLRPDANGIVKNVSLSVLTEKIGCDRRTIVNNMKYLDKHGYIKYTSTYHGTRSILILNYKDAFKKSSEGGKGYVVFNEALLNKLLSIDKIILLRIYLRNMVEIDSYNKDERSPINVVSKSYQSMRRSLPSYCTKKVINSILPEKDDVFHIKRQEQGITFSLNADYIGKRHRREMTRRYYDGLGKYLHNLNMAVTQKKKGLLKKDNEFYDLLFDLKEPRLMILTDEELTNIAQLAVYYDYEIACEAISFTLTQLSNIEESIESYGAYMRSYIEKAYGKMAS